MTSQWYPSLLYSSIGDITSVSSIIFLDLISCKKTFFQLSSVRRTVVTPRGGGGHGGHGPPKLLVNFPIKLRCYVEKCNIWHRCAGSSIRWFTVVTMSHDYSLQQWIHCPPQTKILATPLVTPHYLDSVLIYSGLLHQKERYTIW